MCYRTQGFFYKKRQVEKRRYGKFQMLRSFPQPFVMVVVQLQKIIFHQHTLKESLRETKYASFNKVRRFISGNDTAVVIEVMQGYGLNNKNSLREGKDCIFAQTFSV